MRYRSMLKLKQRTTLSPSKTCLRDSLICQLSYKIRSGDITWFSITSSAISTSSMSHHSLPATPLSSKILTSKYSLTLRKLPKNLNPNDAKSPIRYAPSLIYTTPSAPPPPLFSISHASRNFAIKNSPYKFAIPLPLPSSGPGVTKTNTITRLIPLDFTIGDKLTITFPFHSEALFSWIAFHLSPGFTKYIKRPIEVVGELERDDRRVLKAAGALVAKRKRSWGWLRRGERRTVVTFKLCEVWEGLDIGVDEIGGGRVVERLRGVPVGVWDRMWMRLMEKLEVEGGGLTDDF